MTDLQKKIETILDWHSRVLIEGMFEADRTKKPIKLIVTQELIDKHKNRAKQAILKLIQEVEIEALHLAEYDGKYDLLTPEQRLILKRYHYVNYKHLEDLEVNKTPKTVDVSPNKVNLKEKEGKDE